MSDARDEITPDELETVLDTEDPVRIVDIRSRDAFERGHIPRSENVPFEQLPRRAEEFADAEHVITVCPEGKASLQAMQLLRSSAAIDGHVESLAGGLTAWHDSNGDLETTTPDGAGSEPVDSATDAPF